MMCKAKAWVLALAAGLLLLLIPAQARADVTRLLILNDEQTSETSAAATDVLRRFALYSSWTCTFASSEDVPDTDGYTAVIICTDPNRALNASVALAIQESKLPVFVIGAGGLAELTKTQVHEGSLTLRLQTQANAANDMLLSGNSLLLMKKSGESLGGQIFVGAQAFPLCQTAGSITHLAYFDPSQEAQCAFLSTLLQTWLWPYKNSPTAYGQYLVLDRIYPFADPERLLSLVEMLETENVPYVLCVMPIYANADYPAMKRFCEVLRYAQSRGAVIGKFRTRNRNASLLTRFVNIETLAHQCMNQAGRWFYFGLCTIPGTNFVMHRHIIEEIGGWDPDALSEDTEISFRIYRMGYKIKLVPQAVTWEQEPFRLGIWFKQRTRWAMGNLYVLMNNFKYIFDPSGGKMRMDVLYYALVYILMAFTLVCSDTMFVLGVLGYSHVSLGGLSTMVWVMACALFECNVMLTLAQEKNEFNLQSAALVLLMLFTYSKLWVVVVLRAMWMTVKKIVSKTDYTWYKTERSAD